jgi:hypothetical protein
MHIMKLSRRQKSSRTIGTPRFLPPRHLGYPLGAIFDSALEVYLFNVHLSVINHQFRDELRKSTGVLWL